MHRTEVLAGFKVKEVFSGDLPCRDAQMLVDVQRAENDFEKDVM